MRCRVLLLLCALLIATLVVSAVPAGAQPDTEEVRLEAQLQDDGDARWTIVATIPLENESDAESFRSFAEAFENGERDFQLGVNAFERAAEESQRATNRQMEVRSSNREATLVNETEAGELVSRHGELRVSFTWTSFARMDDNGTMYVDDAFSTTDGTWLPGLDAGQTLIIRSPPSYGSPATSPIRVEDEDLQWEGPQTFEPGYFEIVYHPQTTAPAPDPGVDLTTILLAGALLLSGAALVLGLYLLWRRRDGTTPTEESAVEAIGDADTDTADASGGANGAVAASDADTTAGEEADEEEPNLELFSDEERVEYLLEQNGGRMKQANIVKETGWSNAKVSQLLSGMEEDERIDKLRIGRENLISLPGEGIADIENDSED